MYTSLFTCRACLLPRSLLRLSYLPPFFLIKLSRRDDPPAVQLLFQRMKTKSMTVRLLSVDYKIEWRLGDEEEGE